MYIKKLIKITTICFLACVAISCHALENKIVRLTQKGDALYESNRFSEAEVFFKSALKLAKATYNSESTNLALYLSNLAFAYDEQAKYLEAESLFNDAITVLENACGNNIPDVANALNNLGLNYLHQAKFSEAETIFSRALTIWNNNNCVEATFALNNIGIVKIDQGKFSEAEPFLINAIEIEENVYGSDSLELVPNLNTLAIAYGQQGKYAKAEPLLIRALTIRKKSLDEFDHKLGLSYNNMASVYYVQGKYSQAEQLYLQALKIDVKSLGENNPSTARTLNNLGVVCFWQTKYRDAELYHKRALKIREKLLGENSHETAQSINNLAKLFSAQEKYDDAKIMLAKALEIRKEELGESHPDVALSLKDLAEVFLKENKFKDANTCLNQALKIRETALGNDHYYVAESLDDIAQLNMLRKQWSDAADFCFSAMTTLEKASKVAGSEAYSSQFREKQDGLCNRFLRCVANAKNENPKNVERVFTAIEMSRARAFLDKISAASASRLGKVSELDLKKEKELRTEKQVLNNQKNEEFKLKSINRDNLLLAKIEMDISKINANIHSLEQNFKVKYPKYAELRWTESIDVAQVQNELLNSNEIFLSYWIDSEHLFACVIDKNSSKFIAHPINYTQLMAYFATFRIALDTALDDCELYKRAGVKLFRDLVAPFISDVNLSNVSALYVVPHGNLQTIPFEALLCSSKGSNFSELDYFFKKVPIVYLPSASVLRAIRNDQKLKKHLKRSRKPALLIGDPLYTEAQARIKLKNNKNLLNPGVQEIFADMCFQNRNFKKVASRSFTFDKSGNVTLAPLPGTGKEVDEIGKLFYPKNRNKFTYIQERALESKIKLLNKQNNLKDFRFIHFAAHGLLPESAKGLPEPCLALSIYGDAENDGLLKMSEILDFELDTDLVTLSACQTGVVEDENSRQGFSDLARAFFFAGTPRLTATLWSIDDVGTTYFMTNFYSHLKIQNQNSSPLEALNATRLEMLANEKFCHPFYWAPFVLFGEGR